MTDFSSRDMALIMESYKKITTVKDVTTEEPKKVVKKADIAEPAKKAVPANVCKEAPKTVVKTQSVFEAEDIDKKLQDADADADAAADADAGEEDAAAVDGAEGTEGDDGAADGETELVRVQNKFDTMTPEEVRDYFKKTALDAYAKYRKDVDDGIRAKLGDEEFEKYLERNADARAAADKDEEERIEAELAKLDADLSSEGDDADADGAADGAADASDDGAAAADSATDAAKGDDAEDFWEKTIKFNGKEISRGAARKQCMSKIAQIDSIEGDDEANEEKVAVIQNAIREIRRGADEINVSLNECVCESTTKRSFCGKGKKRCCGTKKCTCKK